MSKRVYFYKFACDQRDKSIELPLSFVANGESKITLNIFPFPCPHHRVWFKPIVCGWECVCGGGVQMSKMTRKFTYFNRIHRCRMKSLQPFTKEFASHLSNRSHYTSMADGGPRAESLDGEPCPCSGCFVNNSHCSNI